MENNNIKQYIFYGIIALVIIVSGLILIKNQQPGDVPTVIIQNAETTATTTEITANTEKTSKTSKSGKTTTKKTSKPTTSQSQKPPKSTSFKTPPEIQELPILNVNTATAEDFMILGIKADKATEIVNLRAEIGGFQNVLELLLVISESELREIMDYLTV
jgi:DNA uptake protein ComE-like DNA-binding protein